MKIAKRFKTALFAALALSAALPAGAAVQPFSAQDVGSASISLEGQWLFMKDTDVKSGEGDNSKGWDRPDFDDSAWGSIKIGTVWESQGCPDYNGIGWYRQKVLIPESWKGSPLFLKLGFPDDGAEVYFNGESIGKGKFPTPMTLRLPEDKIKFGERNSIAIRVWDWYKFGGMSNGDYKLLKFSSFAQAPSDGKAASPLLLSIDRNVSNTNLWKPGWRDEGCADTRPKAFAAKGALDGKDALGFDIWFPNSSGEFLEYKLGPDESGDAWERQDRDYLSFLCKVEGASGEMHININNGHFKWREKGIGWDASFFLPPEGRWERIVIPFSRFSSGRGKGFKVCPSFKGMDTISLGYRNNELTAPCKVYFASFEVGSFATPPAAKPIQLSGLWRFIRDESVVKDNPELAEGTGVKLGWMNPSFDDSKWGILSIGATWEAQGYNFDGVGWFRQKVFVPAAWKGLPLQLLLGQPDDRGEIYFNGQEVARVDKYGPNFETTLKPELVNYGGENTIAVRIVDWYSQGGILTGPYTLAPDMAAVQMKTPDGVCPPDSFDLGAKPQGSYGIVLQSPAILDSGRSLIADITLIDCFYRRIASFQKPLAKDASGFLTATFNLDPVQSLLLFYSETFRLDCMVKDSDGQPVFAFTDHNIQLTCNKRDSLTLPPLAERYEDTPYGKLKLIDEVDCSIDPSKDEHPYKEGGIRDSWIGRRSYSTWVQGVDVKEFKGRKYREANNSEWFGYRLGRGKIKPHAAYLVRIEYPEDKTRYVPMSIEAGRNYQGSGFKTGASSDDPIDPYPLSGEYEWYDNLVFPDDKDYGYTGSRKTSSENGFWIFFMDAGRAYVSQYDAGPAVSRIKVYEVEDIEKHYPAIVYPEKDPKRVLMADWEREPEAMPEDVGRHARFFGLNALSPVIQKWAQSAYYDSKLKWSTPSWHSVASDIPGQTLYQNWLQGLSKAGITLVPRVEYGGSPSLPKEAYAIGPDGNPAKVGRYASWGANLLHPATWDEFSTMIDELIASNIKEFPGLGGLLWRMRNDRMVISYGPKDVELFCKETKTAMPDKKGKDLSTWASSGAVNPKYVAWWHKKRLEFHLKIRDKLRSIRPDLKFYYYNWDPDGWNLGLANDGTNKPQDWTDFYNVHTSRKFYDRRKEARKKIAPDVYLDIVKAMHGHERPVMELYKDVDGIAFFAPVHWHYLADNPSYLNYFRTGDGLAVCNMFNYEEKQRGNVQGHNHESCEMTPGGPAFGMAEEVLCCFHGDPNVITCTTYTYGRGFADTHRRFAQAFLALPSLQGKELADTASPASSDLKIRRYDAKSGLYLGIVHKGYASAEFSMSIPGDWKGAVKLYDFAEGCEIPAKMEGGKLTFQVKMRPMELRSFKILNQ